MTLSPTADARSVQHRRCLASFMDNHPQAFAPPACACSWALYMDSLDIPELGERRVLDTALGMVLSVMRSALQSIPSGCSLTQLFDRAADMGALEFETDVGAMNMAIQGDTALREAAAYGKAIAVYRQCISNGAFDGSELTRMLMHSFDQLPAVTPLMRSAIDTAKRMIQIDIDLILHPESSHAQI